MAIEGQLRDSLAALPPEDFEGVLHPCFQVTFVAFQCILTS
jgi:hypothetical protein